jgi:glucose/arabinose dehydrogenase
MKTKNVSLYRSCGTACVGAILLMAAGASAQNLFVSNYSNGDIYQITPGGTQTLFASGMANPYGLAFNSAGDLFVGSGYGSGNGTITEITPAGTKNVFASGLYFPTALAFNNAGDLFEADLGSGTIYEFTGGVQSTFASVSAAEGLTFNGAGNLFVSSSAGSIVEITPKGEETTLVSDAGDLDQVAFQPVPEPSVLGLLGASAAVFMLCRRAGKSRAERA